MRTRKAQISKTIFLQIIIQVGHHQEKRARRRDEGADEERKEKSKSFFFLFLFSPFQSSSIVNFLLLLHSQPHNYTRENITRMTPGETKKEISVFICLVFISSKRRTTTASPEPQPHPQRLSVYLLLAVASSPALFRFSTNQRRPSCRRPRRWQTLPRRSRRGRG